MPPLKNSSIEVIMLEQTRTFIHSLEQEEKLKAFAMIKSLGELPHPPQLVKIIDKEKRIYEVRGATDDFWIRMFWFYHKLKQGGSRIVVTNGYLKKQNQTDQNEVKKASKIKRSYEA